MNSLWFDNWWQKSWLQKCPKVRKKVKDWDKFCCKKVFTVKTIQASWTVDVIAPKRDSEVYSYFQTHQEMLCYSTASVPLTSQCQELKKNG